MRNKFIVAIAATFLCVVMMASCVHEPNVMPVTVSFKKDIQPIFRASCAINSDCHLGASNANAKIDLDSSTAYNTIVNKQLVMVNSPTASLLYVEVSTGVMPKQPYAPLTQSQLSLILNWIKQGAANN
jgi:hypothetical protein